MAKSERSPTITIDGMSSAPHHRVIVVGTGVGGLGAAIRLIADGVEDGILLERADGVGGVWRDNACPGAPRATCKATCTRSPSRPTPTGRSSSAPRRRSSPTCSGAPATSGSTVIGVVRLAECSICLGPPETIAVRSAA